MDIDTRLPDSDDDFLQTGEPDNIDEDCNETIATDGICPCCGSEVQTIGGNYADESQYDRCNHCGWRGATEYP